MELGNYRKNDYKKQRSVLIREQTAVFYVVVYSLCLNQSFMNTTLEEPSDIFSMQRP